MSVSCAGPVAVADPSPAGIIVLVDDDPAVANALAFSLGLEGFAVRTYADGESLLLDSVPAHGCLVIDYRLPGMDGLRLLAKLRIRGVSLPAVLITSNPPPLLRAEALAARTPIVEKPLLNDALVDAVRRMMTDKP